MRIVLTTFGTFGDVNPLLGLGAALRTGGHAVTLAAPAMFRAHAAAAGLGFAAVRPDQDPNNAALVAAIYDRKHGTERGLREFLFPALHASYTDLLAAVTADGGADLLLSGELAYAAPLVAEKTSIRWASYVLAPFSFFSAYDPPILAPHPRLSRVLAATPGAGHLLRPFARLLTQGWCGPLYELRRELALPPGDNPLFDAKHAPSLVLALYSKVMGAPQPDWPANTRQCGFLFYDRSAEQKRAVLPAKLAAFLAEGPPPLVFTLGSAAVLDPGAFWKHSREAAQHLGIRAVLLTGAQSAESARRQPGIFEAAYAPYSLLFPHAAAIVHQGGIGTTAQALAAGKPMLVMPYSHDQPDNARRVERLGVARTLDRDEYTAQSAAAALRSLLNTAAFAEQARQAAAVIAQEDAAQVACDALESLAR